MAMQVAMTRERLPWFAGVASFFTLGALGGIARGHASPAMVAPLVVLWTITGKIHSIPFSFCFFFFLSFIHSFIPFFFNYYLTAWQYDFAYYNKANRINQFYNDIMKNEKNFWFVQEEDAANKKK